MKKIAKIITFSAIATVSILALPQFTSAKPEPKKNTAPSIQEDISYNRDIRPILSDKCFFCHGPDPETREEGLRLDIREEAIKGKAIIPGHPEKSPLIDLIYTHDQTKIMPPPRSHKKLTNQEKQLLSDWIKAGAEYEPHWAYQAPKRKNQDTIDSLVAKNLKRKGLTLANPTNPSTLLRRLHFDITGLPPTPEEVTAFTKAHASDPHQAVASATDKLLASPHFGERMAVKWLDAVRYADSVGYHGDQSSEVSLFRDYVINSFNKDLPYDQFIIEQIAGDLLPNPTTSQRIASSYNRLGQMSQEGGIQDKEYIAKYQAERVRTTSASFLGSTMACAECHDHKFDPITAKDFYSFAAYFSDILEKGAWTGDGKYQDDIKKYLKPNILLKVNNRERYGPYLKVPDQDNIAKNKKIEAQIQTLIKEHLVAAPQTETNINKWLNDLRSSSPAKDIPFIDETLEKQPKISSNKNAVKLETITPEQGPVHTGTHARKQTANETGQHFVRLHSPISIHSESTIYKWVYLDPKNPPSSIMIQLIGGPITRRAYWGQSTIQYGKKAGGIQYHKIGDLPETGKWIRLEIPASTLQIKPTEHIHQATFTQHNGIVFWDSFGINTTKNIAERSKLTPNITKIVDTPNAESNPDNKNTLTLHHLTHTPHTTTQQKQIQQLITQKSHSNHKFRTIPTTISAKRRVVRLLPRGDWTNQDGPIVQPAPPEFLTKGKKIGDTRLDLAKWIASPDNPLTARVFVNKLWSQFFGSGLSNSIGDFGLQGEYPSNPELLDWLAIEFTKKNWSIKQLIRTIVLSKTYQQTSTPGGTFIKQDPFNRLLARQTQLRLPAELIRDNALAVSGLLNPKIGGRSVFPYQPKGYYRHLNFPKRTYKQSTGENQYRRGIYTHWQRTFLHPMLKNFGAPAREECSTERPDANTPLQALTLLNDPTFTEAARALATKLLKENSDNLVQRTMMTCLSRQPTTEELNILTKLHQDELKRFTIDPRAAQKFISVGASPPPPPTEIPTPQLAAATSLARTILNLHEAITRY